MNPFRVRRFVSADNDNTVSLCVFCKHNGVGPRCNAFPDGIPDEILFSEHDHRKPYPNDHGIRFEPIAKKASKQ